MKILHVLDHSLPIVDGYSIRSHNILLHQKKCDVTVLAVTSPKHEDPRSTVEEIDGIRFYRALPQEARSGLKALPFIKEVILMAQLRARILEVAQQEKINLIHAHSPSLNGIPAMLVARRLRVPVVYEMRSLWEEFPAGYHPSPFERLRFFISQQLETRLLQHVTSVATISQGLQKEVITRGVPAHRTYVFPNGVDINRFAPRPANEDLKNRLGLQGKFLVGFIGSFSYWEGLEVLLRSLAIVAQQQPQVHTLLVGNDEGNRYRTLAHSLCLHNCVTFTGSVTPEQVSDYYSILDLCVYPRKRMRLTELVTPLKPLEAMAFGKLVLASDVGGLRELVDDTRTGFLFQADSEQDLADKIAHIVTNHRDLQTIGVSARARVIEERDWLKIAAQYKEMYQTLLT